ncbi:MAG TPA: response regulator transcription factor [Pyrinomonadaceae bacterium]|jgi:FixJ family two-component response regulator|nr:response regulator transcription factor [Pyrinomonadaceae bacterium]
MDTSPIVYIVDDDLSVRHAVGMLLQASGFNVETCDSAQEFLKRDLADPSGCLVLDVKMDGLSGLELQRELAAANVQLPIIFITGHGNVPMSVQAMKAGAVEFLTKPFRKDELLDAVRQALARDSVGRTERSELANIRGRYEKLTPREKEVMSLVVQGLLNKQVALKLSASEGTIKIHRGHVMLKMQAESITDLVRMADKLATPHSQ